MFHLEADLTDNDGIWNKITKCKGKGKVVPVLN